MPIQFQPVRAVELALEVVVGDPNDLEVLVVEEILQELERGLIAHEVEVIELGLDRPLQHQIPQRSCRCTHVPALLALASQGL